MPIVQPGSEFRLDCILKLSSSGSKIFCEHWFSSLAILLSHLKKKKKFSQSQKACFRELDSLKSKTFPKSCLSTPRAEFDPAPVGLFRLQQNLSVVCLTLTSKVLKLKLWKYDQVNIKYFSHLTYGRKAKVNVQWETKLFYWIWITCNLRDMRRVIAPARLHTRLKLQRPAI